MGYRFRVPIQTENAVYQISISDWAFWAGCPIPLTDGKMLMVYGADGEHVMARRCLQSFD
jgi:hypothetical protein